MFRNWRVAVLLAAGMFTALSACDDAAVDGGRVTLLLTDEPGDFHTAVVTISEVYLQADDGEGEGGRVVLLDEPTTLDLLTLANDVAELVEDEVVPAGTYAQLRFVVAGAYVEVEGEDGNTTIYATPGYDQVPAGVTVDGTLLCPSCAQTGIKVELPGGALRVEGESHVLLVDFDVAESFGHQAGNSGLWVMHPVIRAAALQASGSVVADIRLAAGVTLPELEGTQLALSSFSAVLTGAAGEPDGEIAFADADADGVFTATFSYVLPGDYTITVEQLAGVTLTLDPTSVPVTVESGGTASASFLVTAVE